MATSARKPLTDEPLLFYIKHILNTEVEMAWPVTMFRLVSEPTEPGLCCNKNGLTFAGIPLLVSDESGFQPRPADELQLIFNAVYGPDTSVDAESRLPGLRSVARALDASDLSRAMIASLLLKLPDIDAESVTRTAQAEALSKFSEAEARDWHGRWTAGVSGGGKDPNIVPVQIPLEAPPIGPAIPGSAGFPKPKPSDDDDFLYTPPAALGQGANDNTRAGSQATANDNQPKSCPDPSFEPDSKGRTREQLLYQAQINKLPLGWGVVLNGIKFDGCRDSDQTMQEAKLGGDFILNLPEDVRPQLNEYKDIMSQATRQNDNSGGRVVEWHFSNDEVASYYEGEFLLHRLFNIRVIVTPYDEFYNYNLIRYKL